MLAVLAALPASGCDGGPGKTKAVECRTDDDCDPSELDICDVASCEQGRCEIGTRPDGHRCDDSDPLTGEDACVTGICAGTTKKCDDDLGPCLMAVHDPVTDECTVEPVEDDSPCDDDDACTQADSCQAGACVGAEPKTCEATDDCHVAGECDPGTGECRDVSAPDGTACDDGQACTSNDSCGDGACTGEAVACDDGLACSLDSCDEASGACASDMSQCSCVTDQDCGDGNACNGSEVCDPESKLCQLGTPIVCGPSGDACLSNMCEPETGACVPEPVQNGTACDDQSACTARDTCQAGVCVGGEAVVCAALSQCHLAGVCDDSTGQCTNPEKPNNTTCNDSNACTTADKCQAGACVGGGQVTCQASDQCHDAGVCNVRTGACSNPNKQDGVRCNDANACTNGDACRAGSCTPSAQVVCGALDSCHSVGVCDSKTGVCSNPVKADGSTCNDGLTCTTADKCTAGKCGGSPAVCNDDVACTVDSCSEQLGGCTVNSSACACKTSADCNDNNPCNGVEQCNLQTLQCQAGTAVDCSTLNDACNVGVCSVATGACVASPKQNGTACDDANLCTSSSSCEAGACKGSGATVCTASDQCHNAGACNPATGVCSNPAKTNGSSCNDGSACTKTDSCQGGTCTGSDPVLCAASDQCHTAGTCDASTGLCSDPAKRNGSLCSDGSACTQTDSCQGGVCLGTSPIICGPSDQCHTAGSCDPSTGTCSDPVKMDGTACVDGSLCTQTDTCQSGVCTGGSPITCRASDQCHTAGTCSADTGKCTNPVKMDGTACVDGSLCTKTDTCRAGACVGSNPVTCTASDQCHDAGTCDAATGTCSNPPKTDNTPCNDDKACTGSDKCSGGVCGGASVTCNDGIACTVDSCQEPGGCNFDQSKCGCATNADCNDGNACNGVETCNLSTLSCVAGTAVSCTGLDDACNVGVCDGATGACKAVPRMDGTGCDDGNACTKVDGCSAGKCVGTSPVTCTASDQCHNVGSCDKTTGVCSNPNKANGTGCSDGNACTQTDTCQSGVCTGASPVTCVASDQCHSAGTCDTKTGICSNPQRSGTCDDGDKCTQVDTCAAGVCGGDPRANNNGDWADDPGMVDAGPTSVDIFSDKDGDAHIVGTYHGEIRFNDKELKSYKALPLPANLTTGAYWGRYKETGEVADALNIGGGTSTFRVEHAAGHRDGSFTLLGVFQGTAVFGLDGSATKALQAATDAIYVAHYFANGTIDWVAHFDPASKVPFSAVSVAVFDDDSVIATGDIAGPITFYDAFGKPFAADERGGVWAARLGQDGSGQWARLVAFPQQGGITAHAVTTLDDGGAAFTGTFSFQAALGSGAEVPVKTAGGDNDSSDVWFMKLDKESSLKWGGRVGASSIDQAGDVARITGGGVLLLATTFGAGPNADDSKTTQPLFSSSDSLLQTHVISLDQSGVMGSAGLIASVNRGGGTLGYQLDLDYGDTYSVAGVFANAARFWSKIGFGSGLPPGTPNVSLTSPTPGALTLFAARVDTGPGFPWAVQAGGENSGMITSPWNIVMTGHTSHSVTLAGMFKPGANFLDQAVFGDQVTERLQAYEKLGNPFVVHLNSEAEYDYCR